MLKYFRNLLIFRVIPLGLEPKTYSLVESDEDFKNKFKALVKDTFEDEIADAFIRLLDLCGYMNIDIERHIDMKMRYNALRPAKHGKNY